MYLISQIKMALISLGMNKFRAFLTMLGIIIGVTAVISVMAVGAGAQSLIIEQVTSFGTNLIGVIPGKTDEELGIPSAAFGIEITTLTYEDVEAFKTIPHIVSAYSFINGSDTISYGNKSNTYTFTGTSADYVNVLDAEVAKGRFISQNDVNSIARVVVLGSQVKDELFGADEALNKSIKIKQVSFKVIGIMEERGTQGFTNQDELVFVPVKTAQKLLLGVEHVAIARAKVDHEENAKLAILQMENLLRHRHHIKDPAKDDFTIQSATQALDILGSVMQALNMFLAMVAAISLIVGGIGIMNIMLVSVTERTKEIGLRKALGAKSKHILGQFLVEAVILTSLGGVIGILLGSAIATVISFGVNYFGYNWALIITPASVFIAVFVAWAIGLIFGFWPAKKASKMSPIDALRYE